VLWLRSRKETDAQRLARKSPQKWHHLACQDPNDAPKRKRNVLEMISYSVCGVFLALSLYNRPYRKTAFGVVFIVYAINTFASQYLYLDSYIFFITAIFCDVLIGLLLMIAYKESKPDYIAHSLLILVGMCAVNILGLVLYAMGVNEYFYSGAMFVCNCALILRLMIATRRDGDGYMDYSFLGCDWRTGNAEVLRSGKVV